MPAKPQHISVSKATVAVVRQCVKDGFNLYGYPSALREGARREGLDDATFANRYRRAYELHGLQAKPAKTRQVKAKKTAERRTAVAKVGKTEEPRPNADEIIRHMLLNGRPTLAMLSTRTRCSMAQVSQVIDHLRSNGVQIINDGETLHTPRTAPIAFTEGKFLEIVSDKDNRFRFGAVGDNHCGSKYERRDVFADLYKRFADAGMRHVFHTGNWIDGECRFNKHELLVHGLEQQCRLLAETYPLHKGITTYAVWGDDHEGWYAQREGIDVGTYAQNVMGHHASRNDWKNLGFMEAHVKLVNYNTGAFAMMTVAHPGGGSSYAVSYAIQKIIESLDGGEKPAVGLYGHYHKLWAGNIRNVWCVQTGTGMDQGTFMRKKKIEAHVGGVLVTLEQDPDSGAIIGCLPDQKRYFNRGFYADRWSHHEPAKLAPRSIGGL